MNHVSLSVFRFDDDALVTPHLARLVGHDSPLLHLRRQGNGAHVTDGTFQTAQHTYYKAVQATASAMRQELGIPELPFDPLAPSHDTRTQRHP